MRKRKKNKMAVKNMVACRAFSDFKCETDIVLIKSCVYGGLNGSLDGVLEFEWGMPGSMLILTLLISLI